MGRVGTGMYSDKIGRGNAYALNCLVSAVCLFLMPSIIGAKSVFFLFWPWVSPSGSTAAVWALMPAFTADFFGPKNLGMNYGLVFIGWGLGFFMARLGGPLKTGPAPWIGLLFLCFGAHSRRYSSPGVTKRPMHVSSGEVRWIP